MEEFSDTFALDPSELGCTDIVRHVIDTGVSPPVRQAARRVPFALRGKVEEMVEDMLQQDVIQPSNRPWASPIVLVAKKDGSTRFCVDYRKLNSVTKMDVLPLPRIDDSLDLLSKSKYFTTLDLASGYWQVMMDEGSREKTAFVTHSGLYEFLVMPFGLCNAPSTFQRLMETVLKGIARTKGVVYLGDILIMGETLEDHLENVREVLHRLRAAGLKLNPGKCQFLQRSVQYLGHVVSESGILPDERKVEAVRQFPTPINLKMLRSFLGLASYYRRFIAGFSSVAGPLFALTRKGVLFQWASGCEQAFSRLKELMTHAPLLSFPDFSKPFLLETDASGEGLGAVLAQKQAVVAVLSGTQPLAEGGDDTMSDSHLGLRQRRDPELSQIMAYLDTGELPAEDGKARELVLSRSQYEIIDGVLYYIGKDHGRRVVPAKRDREELFTEAHRGVLGGHLKEAKIYGQLMKH